MPKKVYKTQRKYACPYCELRDTREKLISHVDKVHVDMIPEGYTASRVVYEAVNKKDHGVCMICHKNVYEWDEKLCRYKNLCDDPRCRETVRSNAVNRMIKVYNKPTLLGDPEHQEKMLAGRKISGKYRFQDGEYREYTGTYEKKCLEFMDLVMNIPSKDIQSPGPVFYYDYNGEKHFWITDIYYIPANLVIEIKDGGSNPNTRSMEDYRAKQVAKEEMITNNGKYNYLRLTNNNFAQLLEILADIKYDMIEPDRGVKIKVNENGGLASSPASSFIPGTMTGAQTSTYVVPVLLDNVGGEVDPDVDGDGDVEFGVWQPALEDRYYVHRKKKKKIVAEDFDMSKHPIMFKYVGEDLPKKIKIFNALIKEKKPLKEDAVCRLFFGHKPMNYDEILFNENFRLIRDNRDALDAISYGVSMYNSINENHDFAKGNIQHKVDDFITIEESPDGYFIRTPYSDTAFPGQPYVRSRLFKSMNEITQNDIECVYEAYNKMVQEGIN